MNKLLNGTAWGEVEIKEKEVQIPEFMLSDYKTYSLVIPYSAYQAQGKGRIKRQVRAEKKQHRDFINVLFWCGAAFALLAVAELICR